MKTPTPARVRAHLRLDDPGVPAAFSSWTIDADRDAVRRIKATYDADDAILPTPQADASALLALDDPDADPDARRLATTMVEQLRAFFAGRLRVFDVPAAAWRPTPFRARAWAAIAEIGYGDRLTYGDLAARLETAPRAVGGACGSNPLPIVVPCHRVVSAAGSPERYGYGVTAKRWVLDLETAIDAPGVQGQLALG
ncbi:MAG: methylated-DNA--[protein]-cysteine S-methyltransferase [Acidobacteriota bacterium]